MMYVRIFCLFLFSLFLTACTSLAPSADQNIKWETRQSHLSSLDYWRAQGVMSLRTKNDATKVSFYLSQDADNYELSLYGPLGMGRHVIKGNKQSVTLWDPKGRAFRAASPEALLQQRLGWSVPVRHLQYWLKGLPVSDLPSQKTWDPYHHLLSLEQAGWVIHYEKYAAVGGEDLPVKIRLTRSALVVVIVINTWELN